MRKNKSFSLGVGTTSVIMIFVVVSMVILAIMSYMIVRSDTAIIEKKVNYSIRHSKAEGVAVDTLAKLDEKLLYLSKKNLAFEENDICKKIFYEFDGVGINYEKKYIGFRVGLNANTSFEVKILVNTDSANKIDLKERYTIVSWKTVINSKDFDNNTLNVWK